MEQTSGKREDLFSRLNGGPAQLLIVAGFVLLLASPLIPSFKSARVSAAQAGLSQADALMELDMDDLKLSQERERKEDRETAERESERHDDSVGRHQIELERQRIVRRRPPREKATGNQNCRRDGCEAPCETFAILSLRDDWARNAGLRADVSDPLQLEHDVVCRLPSLVRIFRQTGADDALERRRRHRGDRSRLDNAT
jgi:hypothetical protein